MKSRPLLIPFRNDSVSSPSYIAEKAIVHDKNNILQKQDQEAATNSINPKLFPKEVPLGSSTSQTKITNSKDLNSSEYTVTLSVTSDKSRNKCIEMFYQALKIGVEEKKGMITLAKLTNHFLVEDPELHEPFELDNAAGISIGIEKSLFDVHGSPSNEGYKTTFRSKYLNLKDKTNPALRAIILNGEKSPEGFIKMTTTEMASEERRKEDDRINKENLLKARAAKDNAPETDMFQCGRCKQRKCKYFQMQTRSADEPMTAYITCMNCGNRWKM